MATLIGKYNPKTSWEKQSIYTLDNGWIATLEYSHYGEMVSRLDNPTNGTYWHCSDGDKNLPDFAKSWKEIVVKIANLWILRPKFEKA